MSTTAAETESPSATPEMTADELERLLRAALTPEMWRLVDRLVVARRDVIYDWADASVAELARHFPGLKPAILATWEHIVVKRIGDDGHCCAEV